MLFFRNINIRVRFVGIVALIVALGFAIRFNQISTVTENTQKSVYENKSRDVEDISPAEIIDIGERML